MDAMHGMAWVHWIGVALAAPATVVVFAASWRAHRARAADRVRQLAPLQETT